MEALTVLIRETFGSLHSGFYRTLWKEAGLDSAEDVPSLTVLPLLSRTHLSHSPLPHRLYCNTDSEGLFLKIVRHPSCPSFLIGKTEGCIAQEQYGETFYSRPLVCMHSSHESLEKGLWLYQRGLLPLIAEDNHTITFMAAERYAADALIADNASLETFTCIHSASPLRTSITHIQCIDSAFDASLLARASVTFPRATLSFTLSLPETGSIAHLCPHTLSTKPLFHPDPLSHITLNQDIGTLVVTRAVYLPTPIINYDTEIPIVTQARSCSCISPYTFSLTTTQ